MHRSARQKSCMHLEKRKWLTLGPRDPFSHRVKCYPCNVKYCIAGMLSFYILDFHIATVFSGVASSQQPKAEHDPGTAAPLALSSVCRQLYVNNLLTELRNAVNVSCLLFTNIELKHAYYTVENAFESIQSAKTLQQQIQQKHNKLCSCPSTCLQHLFLSNVHVLQIHSTL